MNEHVIEKLKWAVRNVPDFPKPGIIFKDITPILSDPLLFELAVECFVEKNKALSPDKICAIEARGFIFGSAVAYVLGIGLIPIRKKGKLPFKTHQVAYDLEYGQAEIEMHVDAISEGESVVLIDDLLATGGTAAAASQLISKAGGKLLQTQFLIELSFLKGRENKLAGIPVHSFIHL